MRGSNHLSYSDNQSAYIHKNIYHYMYGVHGAPLPIMVFIFYTLIHNFYTYTYLNEPLNALFFAFQVLFGDLFAHKLWTLIANQNIYRMFTFRGVPT